MRGSCGTPKATQLVGDAVDGDRLDRRIRDHDLGEALRGRVALERGLDVLGEPLAHLRQPRDELGGHDLRDHAFRKLHAREEAQQAFGQRRQLGAQHSAVALVEHDGLHALGPRDDFVVVRISLGVGFRERVAGGRRERRDRRLVDILESLGFHRFSGRRGAA